MGLDQYGMIGCTTEKRVDDAGNEYVVKLAEQDFYWRKHARLQDFMEQLWVEKTGRPDVELNCNDLELTIADIDRLEEAWDIEFAKNKSEGGLFYGHQVQVDQVQNYRDEDLDFIEAAKSAIQEGKQVVYSCWW
jgi:hypothetical protein